MTCRAPEPTTPPQPWGVATRTGDRLRQGTKQPPPTKPVGGAAGRAPERGWDDRIGADTVPVARATERSCGGAGFRADAAERPKRRINRSERRGFFSPDGEPTGAVL